MLKHLFLVLLLCLPAALSAQKFGIVDIESVLNEMPEYAEAKKTIDNYSQKFNHEFTNLRDKFQKDYTDYQNLPADTPESIRKRRAQELQEQDQRMQQFYNDAIQEMLRERTTLLTPHRERVNEAIKAIVSEGSYTMVFEKSENMFPGAEVEDITNAVKIRLGIPVTEL